MKNYIFIALCFFGLGFCFNADAQNTEYKNSIKISPAQFANSTFELNYERFFNEKTHSILLSPAFMLRQNSPESLYGFKGQIQYRYYFSHLHKDTHKTWKFSNIGFYTGLYTQYLNATEEYWGSYTSNNQNYITELFNKDISSIEGGVLIGMQIDIIPRLVLDLYLGGGIKYADVEDTMTPYIEGEYHSYYSVLDREYTGVVPKGGLQIGFNF